MHRPVEYAGLVTHGKRSSALALLTALVVCGCPRPSLAQSRAPSVDACVSASDEGQVSRDAGKYVEARDSFRVCSAAGCPAVVQKNCERMLSAVEAGLPTVVFAARAPDDTPTPGMTTVQVDGAAAQEKLTGTARPINPGRHVFAFRHDGTTTQVDTIINVGEKNRLIIGRFDVAPASAAEVRTPATAKEPASPSATGTKRSVALPVALSLVGAAGVITFAVVGSTALADLHATEKAPCAAHGTCDDQVSSVRTRFLVADIALGTGVIALGIAAVLWLSSPQSGAAAGSARLSRTLTYRF
jgi:hypothetical protein